MRDDFTLDELHLFLKKPDGTPVSRNACGDSWDPALDRLADGWNFDPARTIQAIIRRAEQRRQDRQSRPPAEALTREDLDFIRRKREEEAFAAQVRHCETGRTRARPSFPVSPPTRAPTPPRT